MNYLKEDDYWEEYSRMDKCGDDNFEKDFIWVDDCEEVYFEVHGYK